MKRTHHTLSALFTVGLLSQAEADLITYLTFDDTAGDTAVATFGKDATWANAGSNLIWDPAGANGGAADLSGANNGNNYFELDLGGLLNSTAMTVSMWINPDGKTGPTYEGLFMTRTSNPGPTDGTGSTAGNGNWGFAWDASHIDSRATGATDTPEDGTFDIVADDSSSTSDADGWYHITWVWDGASSTQKTYINGVEAISGSANTGSLVGGTWHIGNDSCCENRDFDGQVDDLAVWDTVLSPAQIAELAAKTLVPSDIDAPDDQDSDGMPDIYEDQFPGILDKTVNDADEDSDEVDGVPTPDGLTNLEEFQRSTDPSNPDTDRDGIYDGEEIIAGTDGFITLPLVDDTDGDGLLDGEETSNANGSVTDPTQSDSDGDTFPDKQEVDANTDPLSSLDPPIAPLPTQGLVALYKFDEIEGTTAADSATLDGAQGSSVEQGSPLWSTEGRVGGALELDGTTSLSVDDPITQGDEQNPGPGAFSISGWIKSNNIGSYKGIFTTRDVTPTEPQLVWGLNINQSNPAVADLRYANANGLSQGALAGTFEAGEWVHLAMTYTTDGFAAEGKAYLNGVLATTLTSNDNGIRTTYRSIGKYFIGDDICCGGREFNGLIDELSVWDVALTDLDISSIYRNGLIGNGISGTSAIMTEVTDITYFSNGDVELTWTSNPASGTTYKIWQTNDLSLPLESWADANDNVPTQGSSTTQLIPSNTLGGAPKIFFALQQN